MAKQPFSLWPREHGAYAQAGVALLTALALAPGLRSLAQALLVATCFLASEPVLILLGGRGPTALQAQKEAALRRLATLGVVATLALSVAWKDLPLAYAWSLLPPALLGLGLFGLFLAKLERTAGGEVLAAWAFAAATPAVVLLGGGGPRRATLLALLLAGLFTLGTAVVHGHLMALRKGGRPAHRGAAFLFGGLLMAGAWVLAGHGYLPRGSAAVLLPMTLAALGIWIHPPAPRHLKRVGWAAAFCALAGGALAVMALC